MLNFLQAKRLAETWISVMNEIPVKLVPELTEAKSYGWIFRYQSTAYLNDPSDISNALIGNCPFLIDRFDGELRVLETARLFEERLKHYESSLPPARLVGKPEAPIWP